MTFNGTKVRPRTPSQSPTRLPRDLTVDVGDQIRMVRWFRKGDGWGFEVVSGRYLGRVEDERLIDSEGFVHHCPISEWSEFRP